MDAVKVMQRWQDIQSNKLNDLARSDEYSHHLQAPLESIQGHDPLTDWGLGVRDRTLHPLNALAKYAQDFQNMSPEEQGMQLIGGGMAGSIKKLAGIAAKKTEYELAHELAQHNATLPIEQGGLGLPPGNTAMDRAKAMGFDTPVYHGGLSNLSEIGKSKRGDIGDIYTTTSPESSASYSILGGVDENYKTIDDIIDEANYRKKVYEGRDATSYPLLGKGRNSMLDVERLGADDVINKFGVSKTQNIIDPSGEVFGSEKLSKEELQDYINDNYNYNDVAQILGKDALSLEDSSPAFNLLHISGRIDDYLDDAKKTGVKIPVDYESGGTTMVYPRQNVRSRFAAFDPFQRNSANILANVGGAGIGLAALLNQDGNYK